MKNVAFAATYHDPLAEQHVRIEPFPPPVQCAIDVIRTPLVGVRFCRNDSQTSLKLNCVNREFRNVLKLVGNEIAGLRCHL